MPSLVAVAALVSTCIAVAGPAAAQVPLTVQHEGLLLDADGLPREGAVSLRFALYEFAEGGAALWFEDHQLDLVDGFYSVRLGGQQPLAGLLTGTRYLGITVDQGAELAPRHPLSSVPFALTAQEVVGDIHPHSVSVGGRPVIDAEGNWVGPPVPGAGDGVGYDTPDEVLTALRSVDGAGSGVDADLLDGIQAADFVRGAAQVISLLLTVDGAGSGLDADRLDGLDSTQFVTTAAQVRDHLVTVDGAGSGVDADRLDGLDSAQFLRADQDLVIGNDVQILGTLTATGGVSGVQMPTSAGPPGACEDGSYGLIYYDTDAAEFYGCTAAGWAPLTGAAVAAAPTVAVERWMDDSRLTPAAWADLPGRELRVSKRGANSLLKVSYQDVLGISMAAANDACSWRLTLDRVPVELEFRSHSAAVSGWRIHPTHLTWYLENIEAGEHILRVQVLRVSAAASECLAGWISGEVGNFLSSEEVTAGAVGITRHMEDSRLTPASWTNLPGRTVTFAKRDAGSLLQVSLYDVLGYLMTGRAGWGCRWRLLMDGNPASLSFSGHSSNASGWRIWPTTLIWTLNAVPAGQHTFQVQVYRPDSNTCSQCLAGWPNGNTGNSLVVREISAAGAALRSGMSDTRLTPNAWTPLPEREVTHIKQSGSSLLRVVYQDNLGYHMVGHGSGCYWRVTVDGVVADRPFDSHTSTAGSWRIHPTHLEWLLAGIGQGQHVYRIEVIRPSSATTSECLAGWPNADTGNFLLVEEL